MKIRFTRHGRWLSAGIMAALLGACGGDKDDPQIITRNDLKSPGGLSIIDLGNGKVRLQWFTSNYEEDFEGYNIYGAKGDAVSLLGFDEGEPVELLNNSGDPIDSARTILQNFNYSADNENSLPGTDALTDAVPPSDGELKFSALPYHHLRTVDQEPNLPTCRPVADGTCAFSGTEKNETDTKDITSVGQISFNFPEDLEVGQSYCFFVFAVQDEGKEISQSSTNVACVVPKYKLTGNFADKTFDGAAIRGIKFGEGGTLQALRELCAGDSGCPDAISMTDNAATLTNTTTDTNVQFENYGSDPDRLFLSTGKHSTILSLGFFPGGVTNNTFIKQISSVPALSLSSASLKNPNGYSLEGQSINAKGEQMYVIASAAPDAEAPESFYYDWLYISESSCATRECSADFVLYLSANPDVRRR
ncbi:MAG: hypothetical protein ACOH5I_10700 [Oligoflexus sp.]